MRTFLNRLFALLVLCCCSTTLWAQAGAATLSPLAAYVQQNWDADQAASVTPFTVGNPSDFPTGEGVIRTYTPLMLNKQVLAGLMQARPRYLKLTIPRFGAPAIEYTLIQAQVLEEDFVASTSDGQRVNYKPGLYYRGIQNGNPNSLAAISFFEDEVMGITSHDGTNYVLGALAFPGTAPGSVFGDRYVFYAENELVVKQNFHCSTQMAEQFASPQSSVTQQQTTTNNCRTIRKYFTADHKIYQDRGNSTSSVVNYVSAMFNVVGVIYFNESIFTNISEVFTYTSPDPYVGLSSTSNILTAYGQNTGDSFNGDLAHFISSRPLGGGVAWLNVMCFTNTGSPQFAGRYAVSGSLGLVHPPFPTFSWDVEVVTHEMGHNLGSPHTHACSWTVNSVPNSAIDGCYTVEGSCATPGVPAAGGTIMSYCHLTNPNGAVTNPGINFAQGFGPLPGNLIRLRTNASNAPCLQTVALSPTVGVTGNTNICGGTPPTLNATPGTGFYYWQWKNNGTDIPGATSASFTPTGAGNYSVEVRLGNCPATSAATAITGAPSADFNVSNQNPAVNVPVTITYAGSGAANDFYFWNFGTNAVVISGTGQGPYQVRWTSTGARNVTLAVATASCTSGTVTKAVTVCQDEGSNFQWTLNGVPNATSTLNVNDSLEVYLFTPNQGQTQFIWNLGGATTPIGQQFSNYRVFRYNAAGVYNVSLYTVYQGCTSATTTRTFTIGNVPPPCTLSVGITNNKPINITAGQSVNFTSTTNGSPTYSWQINGGMPNSSTMANPSNVAFNNVGTYRVRLTATEGSCTAMDSVDVVVAPAPCTLSVGITNSKPINITAGQTVNFTSTTNGSPIYSWQINGGMPNSSTMANPSNVAFNNSGTYRVRLTATQGSCTALDSVDVIVAPAPPQCSLSVSINNPNPINITTGGSVNFSATVSGSAGLSTQRWIVPNIALLGNGNPQNFTFNQAGNLTVVFEYTDVNNCFASDTVLLNITDPAPPCTLSADFTKNGTRLVGSPIQFASTGNNPGGATYSWNFGMGANPATSASPGPVNVTYSSPGPKTISLTVSQSGCSTVVQTDTLVIQQGSAPCSSLASFSVSSKNLPINQPTTFTFTGVVNSPSPQYVWNFGPGAVPATANTAGPHTVSYTTASPKIATLQVIDGSCTTAVFRDTLTTYLCNVTSFFTLNPAQQVSAGAPVTVTYTGNASPNASYNWNFAGANVLSGSGRGPYVISFPTVGSRTVTLAVAENSCTSAVTSRTIQVAPTCSRVTGVTVGAVTSTSIQLSWNPSAQALSYEVAWRLPGATVWTLATAANTSFNVSPLQAQTTYQIFVRANCGGGNQSQPSDTVTASTNSAPPACATPVITTVDMITGNDARVVFTAVPGALSYTLGRRVAGSTGGYVLVNVAGSATSHYLSGLMPNTQYDVVIQANCSGGLRSMLSAPTLFTTNSNPTNCAAPVAGAATAITTSTATVNWTPSAGASTYRIFFRPVGTPAYANVNQPGAASSSRILQNLLPNTTYQWFVDAFCAPGLNSAPSVVQTFTTTGSMPAETKQGNELTNEEALPNTVSIYPNPNQGGRFNLSVDNVANASLQIDVIDQMGRTVLSEEAFSEQATFTRDYALNLDNGTYLVRVRVADRQLLTRVVVFR